MPAPTFTTLTASGTTTDASSYAVPPSGSIAPAADRLILVAINAYVNAGSVNPPTPTLTGLGLTWELAEPDAVSNYDVSGTDRSSLFVFRSMGAAPSSGQLTIDFGAMTLSAIAWCVVESSADVDTSGTNGSGAIVQVVSAVSSSGALSLSINYAPAITAGNTGFSAWGHQAAEVKTPRASWAELADVSTISTCSLETQYRDASDTAGSASWVTGSRAGGVIIEVKAGSGATDLVPANLTQAQSLSAPALTQEHALAVGGLFQQQHLQTDVPLTQEHNLTVAGLTQAQALSGVVLELTVALVVAGLFQQQHLQTDVVLTQEHVLAAAGLQQAQTLSGAALAQEHQLAVSGLSQAQALESPTLVLNVDLVVAGLAQAQVLSEPTLTADANLTVAGLTQAQALSSVLLAQEHQLAVAGLEQPQALAAAALTQAHLLVLAGLTQQQALGAVALELVGEYDAPEEWTVSTPPPATVNARSQAFAAGTRRTPYVVRSEP